MLDSVWYPDPIWLPNPPPLPPLPPLPPRGRVLQPCQAMSCERRAEACVCTAQQAVTLPSGTAGWRSKAARMCGQLSCRVTVSGPPPTRAIRSVVSGM